MDYNMLVLMWSAESSNRIHRALAFHNQAGVFSCGE